MQGALQVVEVRFAIRAMRAALLQTGDHGARLNPSTLTASSTDMRQCKTLGDELRHYLLNGLAVLIRIIRFPVLSLCLFHSSHAQLTDAAVERMKKQADPIVVPAISEFADVRSYDQCVEKATSLGMRNNDILLRMCNPYVPVAEIRLCERPLTPAELTGGLVISVQVDCETKKIIRTWLRASPPDPNFVPTPSEWGSLGYGVDRFTWTVHTRSRNQEKKGWLTADLLKPQWSDYVVCGARVSRISDIGNGNKWKAYFRAKRPNIKNSRPALDVRYLLKPRNWRTDSDLASQTFLVEAYYVQGNWANLESELASPTIKPTLLKEFREKNIKCEDWEGGNDNFAPKPPPAPAPPIFNPFRYLPPAPQGDAVVATGEVRCNNGDSSFGASVRHSATGSSCAEAKADISLYFAATDRCRYQDSRTYPSWSAYPGVNWLQTNTCR